ncbi:MULTISPECIES: aspartate-semialdehyde dehydrogenase [unclassified Pseudomonas]|uniref:aspartate-semialdehyde dehydrogenase n=1 Tax=unclassified Pseudomonas TaxID=196821 RepID=UPI002448D2FA|nr:MULTISPECIES: aspartate-semialdehyde dehydrogenase [unclassified Pseudomonas]MDG9922863.1 aspartate-semialdehyde dehydrogenase [Pseudomonas sp. GD04045]MDH0036856.1 aspartate-semialdehyde dehydrogenase [Pseudomonas sp. GD04019]
MSKSLAIAVIGATGTVGETLVQLLEEREFPVAGLHLLAGNDSVGQAMAFRGKNLRVREVADFDFAQVQLAFFAAGEDVSRQYGAKAHAAGCSVIDLSGGLSQALPVVPEANAEVLAGAGAPYLLASPAPAATALAAVLAPLRAQLCLRKIVVNAVLSVSTIGRSGVSELARQTTELLNMRPLEPQVFGRQVAFNLLAQLGEVEEGGHARLERRIADELKQVLAIDGLKVAVTCCVAPVFFGDSLAVCLEAAGPVDVAAVAALLEQQAGIELVEQGDYPTVVGDAVGQDELYVGRLRAGLDDPAELNLWIASDNVRKGSALNAVQIGELLIKHYL